MVLKDFFLYCREGYSESVKWRKNCVWRKKRHAIRDEMEGRV